MRRYILILFSVIPLLGLSQTKSYELMRQMSEAFESLTAYDVKFSLAVAGAEPLEGYFAIDGDKYYVLSGDLELICDGKNKYDVNHLSCEVNIDVLSSEVQDVLSNPSLLLNFTDEQYSHEALADNKLKLTPKDKTMGVSSVVVTLSKIDNLPLHISYQLADNGEKLEIEVEKISKLSSKDKDLFQYNEKNFSCYEIIDFR